MMIWIDHALKRHEPRRNLAGVVGVLTVLAKHVQGVFVNKRTAFLAALAIGVTVVTSPAIGFAQQRQQQPTAPDTTATVQLNTDTAVSHGLVNKYTNDDFNVALGQCTDPGSVNAPKSTTFSSPVLTFSDYSYQPSMGVKANVSADAKLKPGTAAGGYQLTMTCNGKPYNATFIVSQAAVQQVRKVPTGGAQAGDGSTIE
jgi:hypothetical protein